MPNSMPAADVNVTPDLVRRLLVGQHPDLAGLPIEFMTNGWDNAMFRVGDELVARLPRREVAAAILPNEQRWLPVVAREVPLPIPCPERTGVPADGYPYPRSVVPYLAGEPAADAGRLDLATVALHGDLHPANILVLDGPVPAAGHSAWPSSSSPTPTTTPS